MARVGLRGLACIYFALAVAYDKRAIKKFSQQRWRNVAYATRYGKGCSLGEALSLDLNALSGYVEALSYCVNEEAKAAKPKKKR